MGSFFVGSIREGGRRDIYVRIKTVDPSGDGFLSEMDFCESKGFAQMMRIAQKMENMEDIRREAKLFG